MQLEDLPLAFFFVKDECLANHHLRVMGQAPRATIGGPTDCPFRERVEIPGRDSPWLRAFRMGAERFDNRGMPFPPLAGIGVDCQCRRIRGEVSLNGCDVGDAHSIKESKQGILHVGRVIHQPVFVQRDWGPTTGSGASFPSRRIVKPGSHGSHRSRERLNRRRQVQRRAWAAGREQARGFPGTGRDKQLDCITCGSGEKEASPCRE